MQGMMEQLNLSANIADGVVAAIVQAGSLQADWTTPVSEG